VALPIEDVHRFAERNHADDKSRKAHAAGNDGRQRRRYAQCCRPRFLRWCRLRDGIRLRTLANVANALRIDVAELLEAPRGLRVAQFGTDGPVILNRRGARVGG
jgi:hypothetical protein